MATYEYQCKPCAMKVTEQHPIEKSRPNPKCPKCRAVMTRLFGAPGLTFKGTGWGQDKQGNH